MFRARNSLRGELEPLKGGLGGGGSGDNGVKGKLMVVETNGAR